MQGRLQFNEALSALGQRTNRRDGGDLVGFVGSSTPELSRFNALGYRDQKMHEQVSSLEAGSPQAFGVGWFRPAHFVCGAYHRVQESVGISMGSLSVSTRTRGKECCSCLATGKA